MSQVANREINKQNESGDTFTKQGSSMPQTPEMTLETTKTLKFGGTPSANGNKGPIQLNTSYRLSQTWLPSGTCSGPNPPPSLKTVCGTMKDLT
ncbi:hypothetical protein PoB_005361400 [Plakobranchus ocellatus]|uniref:Uncharacterized protein n=1 Tax=Plakobranchus ocellatus TaxID=259542 RepID=A0AAV4C3J1_9GAST|nr:hypothetical protein PoB_005361400 [Plakobranchus ocellatus]